MRERQFVFKISSYNQKEEKRREMLELLDIKKVIFLIYYFFLMKNEFSEVNILVSFINLLP